MDGDAFFVACEVVKNPQLRGKAVVTGEERGIVSALSYEAKTLGITRGMPIFSLRKKFPSVLVLPGDYAFYAEISGKMFDIVRRYADDVEEYSIDECFADLTGLDRPLYMSYLEIATRIKKEVTDELGLSISVGLAPTKVLAKVASKWQKPNGLTVIEKNNINNFLSKTPVEKIWGIGRRTSEFLKSKGVLTALDFVSQDIGWIRHYLSKPYETLWLELQGIPVLSVNPETKTKYSSIQKTRTFHPPTNDKIFLLSQLSKHIEDACRKARYYSLVPKKLSFFLKTQDFKYYQFTVALETPTSSPEIIVSLARKYFDQIWKPKILYRTAGVTLVDLFSADVVQNDLFGGTAGVRKLETVYKQIDSLEEKFGKRVVYLASTHEANKRKASGTGSDDLDRNLLFL